jgi:hypothetical protein
MRAIYEPPVSVNAVFDGIENRYSIPEQSGCDATLRLEP